MSGVVVLFPLVVTIYVTWWFLEFFDSIFSPIYEALLGFNVFGLGFVTSMAFIFTTGVFTTSYVGSWLHSLGEWIIVRLPIVKHVYSTAKQISVALSPSDDSKAFRECVVIQHPRSNEYAFGFITGELSMNLPDKGVSPGPARPGGRSRPHPRPVAPAPTAQWNPPLPPPRHRSLRTSSRSSSPPTTSTSCVPPPPARRPRVPSSCGRDAPTSL